MTRARPLALAAALALEGCAAQRTVDAPAALQRAQVPGDHFVVEASAPAACPVAQPCALRLRLRALEGYHLNESYPFGFVPSAASAARFVDRGAFERANATEGTLTVRFTPTRPGPLALEGVFRLCVCNEERCQIDTAQVSLASVGR